MKPQLNQRLQQVRSFNIPGQQPREIDLWNWLGDALVYFFPLLHGKSTWWTGEVAEAAWRVYGRWPIQGRPGRFAWVGQRVCRKSMIYTTFHSHTWVVIWLTSIVARAFLAGDHHYLRLSGDTVVGEGIQLRWALHKWRSRPVRQQHPAACWAEQFWKESE